MFWWDRDEEWWYRLAHFTLPFMVFFGLAATLSALLPTSNPALVVENSFLAAVFGYVHRYCKLELTGERAGSVGDPPPERGVDGTKREPASAR